MSSSEIEQLESRLLLSGTPNLSVDASRLVFSQIKGAASRAQYVTLRNTGTAPVAFGSFAVTGADAAEFTIRRKGLPATLAVGGVASVKVTFTPTAAAVRGATLQIASNDPDLPVASVTLRGLGTAGQFQSAEPSLQNVLDTWQIPVRVGDSTPGTSGIDGLAPSDEVPMQFLKKAGPGVVRLTPLAAYSWDFKPVARFGWYRAKGAVARRELFTIPEGNGQTLQPAMIGTTTFDPGSLNFGLYSNWPIESHGDVFSDDAQNTWDTSSDHQHKMRFFPFRKASGKTVPNTYVVTMEEATNGDFQDAVLVIENVMPYDAVTAPTNLAVTAVTGNSIRLAWTDNNAYESSYVIERSGKKNGTYSVVGAVGANGTTFLDTALPAGTTFYYHVRAVNHTGSSPVSNRAAGRTN